MPLALRLSALCLLCVGALPLAGCARDAALRKNPGFQQGYDDGCAAASAAGANPREAPYRNEELYDSDRSYRAGWSSGFSTCGNNIGGAQPYNPLPNPMPGQR